MIKKYLLILIVIPLVLGNTGHRLGKGSVKGFPENTLEILNKALDSNVPNKKGFRYWEFDIRETNDNWVVVHHDRRIPKTELLIDETDYAKVRDVKLGECCQIPNIEEVLVILQKRSSGKVAIEIKRLHSNKSRDLLTQLIDKYNSQNKLKAVAIATKSNFNKSFPGELKEIYCPILKRVAQVKSHKNNLCKKYLE